jgi:hypothetical protein
MKIQDGAGRPELQAFVARTRADASSPEQNQEH